MEEEDRSRQVRWEMWRQKEKSEWCRDEVMEELLGERLQGDELRADRGCRIRSEG